MRQILCTTCLAVALAMSATADAQPATRTAAATQPSTRTRQQIEALIDQAGKTPPDWWDSVQLTYPQTLDLTWTDIKGAPWNPQKNVGQYLWDVIHPNPKRWQEGVKFMHHVLSLSKDNPQTQQRAMDSLSHMYGELLQDYARGAFWARKTGQNPIRLANCYWKLGSKSMAVEILRRIGGDNTRNGTVIKLWADMGEYDTALRLAEQSARTGWADAAYLAAGDACRLAGRFPKALAYYQKVLATTQGGRDLAVNKKRAQASIDAVKVFDALDLSRIPDGKYTSSSNGYAGEVEVQVTIAAGRITDVQVLQHHEKQFYASIDATSAQIIEKQGVKGVDATSGATVTSEAIINASAKALSGAMR